MYEIGGHRNDAASPAVAKSTCILLRATNEHLGVCKMSCAIFCETSPGF